MTHYRLEELSKEDFLKAQGNIGKEIFADDHAIYPGSYLSDDENLKIRALANQMSANPFSLHVAAFDEDDKFVAWSYGWQENSHTFYMCNSGVVEDHRRKGLYTQMLNYVLNKVKEKGFQVIYSRHNAVNNAVIIPKLKAGFVISSIELSETFGYLVHLKYLTNETRKKVLSYRSGQISPDSQLQSLFKS